MYEKCQTCHREFKVNLTGKIRRHWCLPESGDSKALTFATGGTLRVRLDANWMLFGDAERALLNTIIDAIDAYEQQHPIQEPVEPAPPADAVGLSVEDSTDSPRA